MPERFDGKSVRRMLQRAAEEQHRLDRDLADSYSLEELEEMAAQARISPEALRAAIEAESRADATARQDDQRGRRRTDAIAALESWMPGRWSPGARSLALAGGGFAALSATLLWFWLIAPALFWGISLTLVALSLLLLLGATPF